MITSMLTEIDRQRKILKKKRKEEDIGHSDMERDRSHRTEEERRKKTDRKV